MARKKRDYKKEYAAAKRRAQSAGYKSEREYKAVRKTLGTPRGAMPAPRRVIAATEPEKLNTALPDSNRISRMRKQARDWSDKHSRNDTSAYRRMTDEQLERYHRAYIEPLPKGMSKRGRAREKRARIHDFLVPDFMTQAEWDGKYVK